MKIVTASALSLMLLCGSAHAESFKDMFMREGRSAIGSGGKVLVIFHSDRNLETVTATISSAMKVTDPNAVMAKQWVTEVTFRGYDKSKKCGVVVGTWWSSTAGKLASDWEPRVMQRVKSAVNTLSFQYARDSTLRVLEGTVGSDGDDLLELCM